MRQQQAILKGRPLREIIDIAIIFFVIACVLGSLGESIYWGFDSLIHQGQFIWTSRRGFMYGPFAPLYGVGILIGLMIFGFKNFKGWQCFVIAALAGGTYEFLASIWQELCFGTRSWDYSQDFDSIGGRTKFSYLILWGLVGLILAKVLLPLINNFYNKLPKKSTHFILMIVLIFFIFNTIITIAALVRQTNRHNHIEARNHIERWIDDTYPDKRIHSVFEGTEFIK